jgi:hypothetical protein
MDHFEEYLEEEFIIWNPTFGVRDFAMIGEIKKEEDIINIWMDDPYDMVGPLNLQELLLKGEIAFEACLVMTKKYWQKDQNRLKKESYNKQQKIHKEFQEDIKQHNKKREYYSSTLKEKSEKEYRKLLALPLNGKLEISQIKTAYRKIAKSTHPDVGGDHETFVLITEAKDALSIIFS